MLPQIAYSRWFVVGVCLLTIASASGVMVPAVAQADEREYESPEIRKAIQTLQKNGAHVDFYENYEESTSYYVNLYATKASDDNLQALLVLPRVERLWLGANFELSPRSWGTLTQLGELEHLHLFGDPTDDDLAQLALFTNLVSLQLNGQRYTPQGLWYLEELTRLEQLSLKLDGDCEPYFTYLARLPNLSQLSVYDPDAKTASLNGIEKLKKLNTLAVNFGKIEGDALQSVADLPLLKNLTITNATFAEKDLDVFRKLRLLEHLSLHYCEFPDSNLEAFEGLEKLQHLSISNTNLIDEALAHLSKLPSLNYLHLNLTPITDEGLKHLHLARGLETLHLRSTEVTAEGVAALSAAVPNLRVIAPMNN